MEQKKNIDLTTFKLDDFFSTQEDRDEDKKEKVEIIDLSLIDDFQSIHLRYKKMKIYQS